VAEVQFPSEDSNGVPRSYRPEQVASEQCSVESLFKTATTRSLVDSHAARRLIEKCFPQLRIHHSRQIVTGWENLVLEVNREYIFRFPKYRETEERLRSEIAFLPALRREMSVEVPDYEFVWRGGPKYPHWFGGYRKISGVTVGSSRFRKEWLRPLAAQIAESLKQLHRVRVKTNRFPGIPVYSPNEWLRSTRVHYRKIRRIAYRLLNSKLRARSERFWQNLLEEFREANFEPTLIHGDLGGENILFDPARVKLTGILDWGYLQMSDPALEFAHLFIYKPALGEAVLKRYGAKGSEFKKRVQFYVDSEPFYDTIWGLSHHWDKARELGLSQLAKALGPE
jgi:aminoglycoside 2''-phosphotransferase